MKKIIAVIITAVLTVSASATVFAHGHGYRHGSYSGVRYSVCGLEDCTLSGIHSHNGLSYASHYYGDGHAYHGYSGGYCH